MRLSRRDRLLFPPLDAYALKRTDREANDVKQGRTLLETTAQRLALPVEVVAGLPRVELLGFGEMTVEHHRGITEYTEEAVSVTVAGGRVRVTGRGLSITLMNREYVTIRGALEAVALEREGGHD